MKSARRIALTVCVAFACACSVRASDCIPADFNSDDNVGPADLATLLAQWGQAGSIADLNHDNTVGPADLAALLASWGTGGVALGVFPAQWISGNPNCATEPVIQVHQYNENMYILRQSICTNFEGPFIYLLFGQNKVLMQDTGASNIPLASTVYGIINQWLVAHRQQSIQLIVTHSHSHGDHIFNDSQFIGQPNTTVVGTSLTAVQNFFGIPAANWPTQIVQYDLGGGRIIDVIPIPGHQTAHIALYDRQTRILFTGDTLYPGRLYISNWSQYKASIQRMVDFTANNPVCHVLGTHIEMTTTPTVDYQMGASGHPNEHVLELSLSHLIELNNACISMGNTPVYQEHADFIIYPL